MEKAEVTIDAIGVCQDMSRLAEDLLGVRKKQWLGKRLDYFVGQESAPRFLWSLIRAYQGKRTKNVSVKIITPRERFVNVDMSFLPKKTNTDSAVIEISVLLEKHSTSEESAGGGSKR